MTAINKYNKSMIYTIRSPSTDKYYIGSTTQLLCKRFGDHKYKAYLDGRHHFVTSFKLLELGNSYIELLQEYECDNKNQLEKREGELIREHKNNCVNKRIEGRTYKEWAVDNKEHKEYDKQYFEANKDKINERKKQWRVDNKDKIAEKDKKYRDAHKEQKNQYYIDNKEKINASFTCECGSVIQHSKKARHNRTIKHMDYISTIIV